MDWKRAAIALAVLLGGLTGLLLALTLLPVFDPDQVYWPGVGVGYLLMVWAGLRIGSTDD